MAVQIRPQFPSILIVDGLDVITPPTIDQMNPPPAPEYRPALQQQIYAAQNSPVTRGSHTLWVAFPYPAQPREDPYPPNFVGIGDDSGGLSPRPLRGVGDMRAIPPDTADDSVALSLYQVLHEAAHGWLVPADLQFRLPAGAQTVLGSWPLTVDIMHGEPYGGPGLLGRSDSHWGVYFQADGSFMDGISWDVVDAAHATQQWTQRSPQIAISPTGVPTLPTVHLGNRYCDLDLYIMGLKPARDCYPLTDGRFSWMYPRLAAGTPMQYQSGLFAALADGTYLYFGFLNDHRTLAATTSRGWRSPPTDLTAGYDALGGARVGLRIVWDGSTLFCQAQRVSGSTQPDLFTDIENAATAPRAGDVSTWQTVDTFATAQAPTAVGVLQKTSNPVLVETRFDILQTRSYQDVDGPRTHSLVDGVLTWPRGPLLGVPEGSVFQDLQLMYAPPADHPEATYNQVRRAGSSVVLGTPWDQSYDDGVFDRHGVEVHNAPKLFVRGPSAPFAVATVASVVKGGIGPAAGGGARGTVLWGDVASASIDEVIIPARLEPTRHDAVPWRVAFIVATADAADVPDADLERLDILRRYYEAAAPVVSDGTLTVRTDLGWQSWPPVSTGTFDPRTPVSAVSDQAGFIDLFAVGQDNRVWTDWFHPPQTWPTWQPVLDHRFPSGTPISVVSDLSGRIDLFAVGQGDLVQTAWFHPPQGWQGWQPVLGQTLAPLTPIAVISDQPGFVDLFAVDRQGFVQTAWFHPPQGWQGWQRVLGGVFTPATPIAAVSDLLGRIDLFAVGLEGAIYTAWLHPSQGWQGWEPVLDRTFALQTPIAAVCDRPGNIDLFAVGPDGRVFTAWFRTAQGWQGWQPILNGTFAQLTPVAAVTPRPGQIDLFAVGQDGRIWTAWLAPPVLAAPSPPRWQGWSPIGDESFASAAGVAAVTSRLGQIDLFAVGRAPGQVRTAWFVPG